MYKHYVDIFGGLRPGSFAPTHYFSFSFLKTLSAYTQPGGKSPTLNYLLKFPLITGMSLKLPRVVKRDPKVNWHATLGL